MLSRGQELNTALLLVGQISPKVSYSTSFKGASKWCWGVWWHHPDSIGWGVWSKRLVLGHLRKGGQSQDP